MNEKAASEQWPQWALRIGQQLDKQVLSTSGRGWKSRTQLFGEMVGWCLASGAEARIQTSCPDRPDSMALIKTLVAAACDLPLPKAREFFRAFSRRLDRPILTGRRWTGETLATQIYLALFAGWKEVEAMRKVGDGYPELLDWLKKRLGADAVGDDVQRIQRLCNRVELHMRKPGQHGKKPRQQRAK